MKNKNYKKAMEASFHKDWLTKIKSTLGSSCTFISHKRYKENYFLEVRIKNDKGGVDKVTYKLQGAPNTLTTKDYQSLLSMLRKKEYDQGSEKTLSPTKTGKLS